MARTPSEPPQTRLPGGDPPLGAGLEVVALPTPTLPPATTTNCVLVGRAQLWVVDPAPPRAADRERLAAALAGAVARGAAPRGIVLTHHHADHVGAAAWLRGRTGLPILAHAETARRLAPELEVDGELRDGDLLDCGDDSDGPWQVLHTPGHAPGHVALWQVATARLVAGDMVAATGTILVAPPEGHMATYLRELERLAALAPSLLVAAHGPPLVGREAAVGVLRATHAHRLEREARVVAALTPRPQTLAELTAAVYADLPAALHGLAAGSALAHLDKLAAEGRALCASDGCWSAR